MKSIKDTQNDIKLAIKQVPLQAEDAYKAYENMKNRYDGQSITVAGYSLGGSLTQILCNETGAEGITFESYGVGNIVAPKYTNQITNFGNENDPIFKKNMKNQLGTNYIIPDSDTPLNSGLSISKHMPNQIGDVTKAIKQEDLFLKKEQNKNIIDKYTEKYYDENLLNSSNRVFYENEMKIKDMDNETLKQFVNQYYDDNYKMPKKEELERRARFGELIYVEDYTRSDGVKVSGYYRSYPRK